MKDNGETEAEKMELAERIRGGLYGVAVGDALGGTTEFMSPREIAARHGYLTEIVGGGVWRLEPGEVTNDTMMTLCVADGILAAPDDPKEAIGERFLRWYASGPEDVGNIIRTVLATYEGDWFQAAMLADLDLGQSAGNGSLMRCLPAALCYPAWADVSRVSRMQSKMTHYDELCNEACEIYNRIAFAMLDGEAPLREAVGAAVAGTPYEAMLSSNPDCETSGYVVHTFRWVLHLLLTSNSFEEVVQRAANQGGDSDTIGAIAGGLAGVHWGFAGIPERYAAGILIRERLDATSERILALRRSLAPGA
ncbi:ADP-ribosylglycohydrolase family protein [Cohnella ginsengisoli]|uniref:ADP-ribosylglycohydrolase family protein n=1 Tax=Cohnella ginsengisoli TaxID=425004 RepID=A0A9X4KIS8_9BACL|nr:ADP-ribosylglycohydrolase family protein [Cohnella ginsengisoli]MDG0792957.1 ADP-ribosylglycohydrolase family protein [Cohnella ginsengisoli]